MLVIPQQVRRLCHGWTRREFIRVGGAAMFGLSLPELFSLKARASAAPRTGDARKGFGQAQSVILLFLQGGPSHLDIWDPKPDAPSNIRGEFKAIKTKVPGVLLSETMPLLAEQLQQCTLIRSMSYTPEGLFNHTAAMYQMLTGYPPDKVSPSGQLEPPSPRDFPTCGSWVSKLKPPAVSMLPFVELPRALQESNVVGKGGAAGFLGRAYDPYRLYQDPNKPIKIDDLALRSDVGPERLKNRFELRKGINDSMKELEQAVSATAVDEYYAKAFDLVLSGKAREAFDLEREPAEIRDKYGRTTFGQGALLARRLVEAGTRLVQLNWPSVANGDPETTAFDTHAANFGPLKNLHCPVLDRTLASLLEDLNKRGLLETTLVVAVGEFGRSPRLGVSTSGNTNAPDGRDHWPYCYTALIAGAGVKRGFVYGRSDQHGSAPVEDPVHPTDLLATVYYALGIDPAMEIMNDLNQPRPLVKGDPLEKLFG
jgi:uncharacterized protein (DUF1501 family)